MQNVSVRVIVIAFAFALALAMQASWARAQHSHHAPQSNDAEAKPPAWAQRDHGLEFPVSTRSSMAKRLFEQGLLLVYAFNHDAATKLFAEAARHDPAFAMAHWGIALANGSYVNAPFTSERYQNGRTAIGRATQLLAHASPGEQGYIEAMSLRYQSASEPDYRTQQQHYAGAMRALSDRYPDDLHAATLYADSRMTLNPWRQWSEDGRPADGTADIVETLESVLRRDPNHLGANHLLVHALEASPQPERALASAMRLEALDTGAGHLAHMPGHIYMRLGDYAGVVRSNLAAIRLDETFLTSEGARKGKYTRYHLHNLDFVIVGFTELGNASDALRVAEQYEAIARQVVQEHPGTDDRLTRPATVLLRFNRWKEVLALPRPDANLPVANAYFTYARGVAHAGLGQLQHANDAHSTLRAAIAALPDGAGFRGNDARHVMAIAERVLDARISLAAGDSEHAIDPLRQAVALQDGLRYDEPPSWDVPLRETLAAALLRAGSLQQAEAMFREGLSRNPRGARALFGLRESLRRQSSAEDAALVDVQFRKAWAGADVNLTIESL